jgi:hypothetical protein
MSVDTREPAVDDGELGPQTRNGHPIPDWHYSRVRRDYGYAASTRLEMIHDLAAKNLSYAQIGAKYGRKENAVKQFAFQNKREIGQRRAELLVGLRAACNGALQYRVDVLKQIVQECQDRLEDLRKLVQSPWWILTTYSSRFVRDAGSRSGRMSQSPRWRNWLNS